MLASTYMHICECASGFSPMLFFEAVFIQHVMGKSTQILALHVLTCGSEWCMPHITGNFGEITFDDLHESWMYNILAIVKFGKY
jgi:hypothetical protein